MQPIKSKAQLERFKKMVEEGKMTQNNLDLALSMTKDIDSLPDRLHPKPETTLETPIDFGA